jgi:hypothetical protein
MPSHSHQSCLSRDVVFEDNVFPFSNLPLSSTSSPSTDLVPVSSGQLLDSAYFPDFLPCYGAATELLEDVDPSVAA